MKHLSQLLVVLWCFVLFSKISAQTSPDYCFFNEFYDTEAANIFNRDIQNTTQARTDELLTIPVVIHIMHLPEDATIGSGSNISDAQITAGLAHLNEAFRNIGDYAGGPFFSDTGVLSVDTNIEFCLADTEPEGSFSTGINRIPTDYSNLAPNQSVPIYGNEDGAMKAESFWDSNQYLNIWLVNNICNSTNPELVGCGTSGYALFPNNHGNTLDGVVMRADMWGTSTNNSKVQVHEIGHYLGLYHTFQSGCSGSDCSNSGDRVCDTPPDNSTNSLNAGEMMNSCDNDAILSNSPYTDDKADLHENYMDYGNRSLWNTFTLGQKTRMRATLETTRNSLFAESVCSSIVEEALPLDLISFKGKIENKSVKLEWKTENELDIEGFAIEFSEDSRAFSEIGFIASKKSETRESYIFTASKRSSSNAYYRLKIVESDGYVQYSEVILLQTKKESDWLIFPNPVHGDFLNVQTLQPISSCDYIIFDSQGKKILDSRFEANAAVQTFIIPMQGLESGIYFLEILTEEGRSFLRFMR
jgi:hypothetical protein